ncbi:MAG: RagB/SusD family nutrient uptake outer membrane protein [Candidatus Cryptobacteroides sp.]
MKHIRIKLLVLLAAAAFIQGCDSYLDQQPLDLPTTTEDIFSSREKAEQALYQCYSWLPQPWALTSAENGWGWDAVSDVVVTSWQRGDNKIRNGSWNPTDVPYKQWQRMYRGISDCNYFLANIDICKQLTDNDKTQYKGEVRFLRAYMYNYLIRLHGPVVLMGDDVIDPNKVVVKGRSPFDECVEYVANEFLEASKVLPPVHSEKWTGKPTKGAALAMRSQLLLFAASPLFNPKGESLYKGWKSNTTGEELMPQTYDAQKWKDAAAAAKLVIDMPDYALVVKEKDGKIDPYASLRGVFLDDWNSEVLWGRYGANKGFLQRLYPSCWKDGWGGYGPTQKLVDSYAMSNGRYPITGYSDDTNDRGTGLVPIIDETSGYVESGASEFEHPYDHQTRLTYNMYTNREPRFYTNIIYDGMYMPFVVNESQYPANTTGVIFTQVNYGQGGNANSGTDYSPTGYGTRTWVSRACDPTKGNFIFPVMPFIRLAEVYLNYTEALIESGDLDNPDLFKYWNMIRERAGVPDIQEVYPEIVGNQELLRKYLRRERFIEQPFENLRYFDLRRWQIADKVLPGPAHGMNVRGTDGSGNGQSSDNGNGYDGKHMNQYNNINPSAAFFKRVEQDRVTKNYVFVSPKHYLYPIEQREIDRNDKIEQAPGW